MSAQDQQNPSDPQPQAQVPAAKATDSQDEIDKIMNDIQALQKEMDAIGTVESEPEAVPVAEFVSVEPPAEPPMDLTGPTPEEEIRREDAEKQEASPLVRQTFEHLQAHHKPSSEESLFMNEDSFLSETKKESLSSLTMSVKGAMKMILNYESGAEELEVQFSENEISIRFSSGLQMKVPVRK